MTFDSLAASYDLYLLWSIRNYGNPKSLADKINGESNQRGGPMTRSRTDPHRIPMTRDNQHLLVGASEDGRTSSNIMAIFTRD